MCDLKINIKMMLGGALLLSAFLLSITGSSRVVMVGASLFVAMLIFVIVVADFNCKYRQIMMNDAPVLFRSIGRGRIGLVNILKYTHIVDWVASWIQLVKRFGSLITISRWYALPLLFILLFLFVPLLSNAINSGYFFSNTLSKLDLLFRLWVFYGVYVVAKTNGMFVWNGFFKVAILSGVYVLYVMIEKGVGPVYPNSLGIYLSLFVIAVFHFSNSNILKILLFLVVVFSLIYVMRSRAAMVSLFMYVMYVHVFSSKVRLFFVKHYNISFVFFVVSILLMFNVFIFLDNTVDEYHHWVTGGRGFIWSHYFDVWMTSPWIGLGDSHSLLIRNIKDAYDGAEYIAIAIGGGGSHSTVPHILTTRGGVGMLLLMLFVYMVFFRRLHMLSEINMGMFLFSLPLVLTLESSTIGGLTISSVILLLSILVPYKLDRPTVFVNRNGNVRMLSCAY